MSNHSYGGETHRSYHTQDEHHVCMEQSMFGPVSCDTCVCGAAPSDPLHHAPPCEWCRGGYSDFGLDLGEPGPWWHRRWCRFVAWWLRP